MGALLRATDFSTTSLGPVSSWPQSLRTTISIMLAAPQPSYVFWGPDLAMLYNDAGLPFVGLKHPGCLGQPTRIVLAEAWPVLGPLIESAMGSGTPVYLANLLIPLDRNGFLQDGYFTFSYIPTRNEAAEIGGILVIVYETTQEVVGARRLSVVRELSMRAALCQTVSSVFQAAEDVLGHAAIDVPFALLYELRGRNADLVVCAGLERGLPASPAVVDLEDHHAWPLDGVGRPDGETLVPDLAARFGALPAPPGGEAPNRALLVPVAAELEAETTLVLIAGLNPRYPLDDDLRSFLGLLGRQIATSIAATRALEQKTQRAAELAELDRQKTAFFSNVSHEFRTPLTLMLSPLEDALQDDLGLRGDQLASVHRNALRLLRLVNNLLDFSRVEAGRAHPAYKPTDLALLTRDLASGFRSLIEAAGITFELACLTSGDPIRVDADMWEKVVLNLLSNAFKFTFEGKIAVRLLHVEGDAVLSVSDTGVGIPAEEIPHLFDRFHRVQGSRSRTHEGSGIGLALVAELARLHGGSVTVESRVGEGSTFTVRIPWIAADLTASSSAPPVAQMATASGAAAYLAEAERWLPGRGAVTAMEPVAAGRSARILVADDNADMRDYLVRLLSERWTVDTAVDGHEALAKALARPPDAIVSDMMMPGLDGLALVRALRADQRTRGVPFVLVSARADEQTTVDALAQGASDYLLKPFSARDLLARVGAQLDIAAAQRDVSQRLESFLMEAPAAIAVLRGPSLTYVLANERYVQTVGRADLLGKPGREALPELVEQGVWDILDRVVATGAPFVAESFAVELRRGANGALEKAFFNWTVQPTRGLDGVIDGALIFAIEVTEQVRARQRLEEASAIEQKLRGEAEAASRLARSADRAKDEFLAMLGHELRNPLAPIATALQLMRLRGNDGLERERLVIERQVQHLEGLVSDLLDVSRVTQGKFELKRARLDVSEVLTDAIEMASPLLEQKHHRLEVRIEPSGLIVDGDPGRLKQVFANLLTNAAKYTEAGGHLLVEAHRGGDFVVVEVTDDGVGISADMLPRVFDLFSQVPQSLERSQGGLGLGLSIVRSIVGMHGGHVRATSAGAGQGSTFRVELPAATGATRAKSFDSGPMRPISTLGKVKGRILIVDDNHDAAELLSDMLASAGHATQVAHDGLEALGLAKHFKPTVALLDIGLPVMDGYELARRLRGEPSLRGLRLIAITGYGQSEDRRRSEAAGFDAHLVKPVKLESLAEALDVGAS